MRIYVEKETVWIDSDIRSANLCKSIPSMKWDGTRRRWHVKADAITVPLINQKFPPQFIRDNSFLLKAREFGAAQTTRFDKNNTTQPRIRKRDQWEHQTKPYNFAMDAGHALLGMWMGTGKTKTTIDCLQNWYTEGTRQYVLIVAPKKVCEDSVWEKEFEKDCTVPYVITNLVVDGKTSLKKAQAVSRCLMDRRNALHVFITNYDSIYQANLFNVLEHVQWLCIVADESHHIKTASGARSQAMVKLRKNAQHRLALTGTPMAHQPVDIFAQFKFVNPMILGESITRFRAQYCVMGGYDEREVIDYQNVDELQNRLSQSMYLLPTNEVLNLPEPLPDKILTCKFEPDTRKLYDVFEEALITEWNGHTMTADNALVKSLRLQQMAGGWLTDDDGGNAVRVSTAKMSLFRETLGDIHESHVVVFAAFTRELADIESVTREFERNYFELSGKRNQIHEWRMNGGILGVQIQAGAEGIDLTASRIAIYNSTGFSLGRYEQSQARIHRPGQENQVLYIHLSVANTIDTRIRRALRDRRDDIDAILGGVQ